ncbi:hypothetical protein ACFWBS_44860 [Streptomyces mirabilis]|uniref:hypothetical protein n=1 Tax=Streptomyces TaxID=1883 RepID=UPI000BD0B48D|nr:hypothetical protein [Streptomyces sp. OK228]SOE39855.1 hypothetical protein SAMN05442782_11288 [Streptomyces sp. OK228]
MELSLALREPLGEHDVFRVDAMNADEPFAPNLAGREAIFDQALTNGLAAIVAHEWAGEEADAKGRMLSARALLRLLEGKTSDGKLSVSADGVLVIPDPHEQRSVPQSATTFFEWAELPPLDTRIDVRVLDDALDASQPARHARGVGGLKRRHIEALLALDDHESLRVMSEQHEDRAWQSAREEDGHSLARAVAFLQLIGDEEAAERAERVENPNDYHPKHNPDGHDLELCPVCGFETFCVRALDTFGRVGIGQCLVCTYVRSLRTADDEGFSEHLAWLGDKD